MKYKSSQWVAGATLQIPRLYTFAVAAHWSCRLHAPAMKLISPVRLSGIPIPFSMHQCKHSGAQIVLLTRLLRHERISRRSASFSCAWISSLVSALPTASRWAATRLFRRMCCRQSTKNWKKMCPNQPLVLQIYHLSIPPYFSTNRFGRTPLEAR